MEQPTWGLTRRSYTMSTLEDTLLKWVECFFRMLQVGVQGRGDQWYREMRRILDARWLDMMCCCPFWLGFFFSKCVLKIVGEIVCQCWHRKRLSTFLGESLFSRLSGLLANLWSEQLGRWAAAALVLLPCQGVWPQSCRGRVCQRCWVVCTKPWEHLFWSYGH